MPPFVVPAQLEGVSFTVGEGSEATFSVTEQLAVLPLPNEAVVRTSGLGGAIHLDGRPTVITIDLRALASDQSRRDRYIRNTMFPDHETATLTVEGIGALPERYDGEVLEREVTGLLSIRGVEAAVPLALETRLDGDMLFVLGRGTFTWQQLEIEPPSSAAAVSVEDEVRVEVLLAARADLDDG